MSPIELSWTAKNRASKSLLFDRLAAPIISNLVVSSKFNVTSSNTIDPNVDANDDEERIDSWYIGIWGVP